MLAIELLALVALLGVSAIVIRLVWSAVVRVERRADDSYVRTLNMANDLRDALKSGDHRRLDDFMVLWGSTMDPQTARHVQARRDELYLDSGGRS